MGTMKSAILVPFVLLTSACATTPPPPQPVEIIPYKGAKSSSGDVASVDLPKETPTSAPVTAPPNAKQSETPPADAPAAPAATEDPSNVFHRLPPGTVLNVVRPVLTKVKACFKEGLARDPSTEGEVRIRFVITHEGAVVDAKDEGSSMPDEEVTSCIAGVIKALKFPVQEAPGGAFGIYSINLQN